MSAVGFLAAAPKCASRVRRKRHLLQAFSSYERLESVVQTINRIISVGESHRYSKPRTGKDLLKQQEARRHRSKKVTLKAQCKVPRLVQEPAAGLRPLQAYLSLPVEEYSLLDPTWIQRDPTHASSFLLTIPLQDLMGLDLQPKIRVTAHVDPEEGQVAITADSFTIGDPRLDGEFDLQLHTVLSCSTATADDVKKLPPPPTYSPPSSPTSLSSPDTSNHFFSTSTSTALPNAASHGDSSPRTGGASVQPHMLMLEEHTNSQDLKVHTSLSSSAVATPSSSSRTLLNDGTTRQIHNGGHLGPASPHYEGMLVSQPTVVSQYATDMSTPSVDTTSTRSASAQIDTNHLEATVLADSTPCVPSSSQATLLPAQAVAHDLTDGNRTAGVNQPDTSTAMNTPLLASTDLPHARPPVQTSSQASNAGMPDRSSVTPSDSATSTAQLVAPSTSMPQEDAQVAVAAGPLAKICGDVRMSLTINMPPPLAVVPGPLLQYAGGTIMKLSLQALLPGFLELLALDYTRWASGQLNRNETAGSLLGQSQTNLQSPAGLPAAETRQQPAESTQPK